ncbi:MAG: outer membrane protein assembly factor BamB [gamma proteobacterium symbiont of Taylorina sp.]|nr:outer membrane protein assembly factor BamB [gamma proteobacterium symbiont of Taylorina sp.]
MKYRLLLLVFFSLSLTACGFFSGDDNSIPPTELETIEQSAQVNTVWSRNVGVGVDEVMVNLVPIIVGDEIFTVDREGQVTAADITTGTIKWQVELEMMITGGIGAGEGLLVVGNNRGEIIALDAENGSVKWQKQMSSVMLSAPLIQNEIILSRTGDGRIYALDTDAGQQVWVYDRGVPVLTLRGNSSPILGGQELVFTGFDSGKITAVIIKDGRLYWEVNAAVPSGRSDLERLVDIDGAMILIGRVLYAVSYQGRIVAINAMEGKILWSKEMSSYAGIAADERQIYVTDSDSNLWAVDRVNGNLLWKQDKLSHRELTAPVSIDEYILVGDYEGYIHILSQLDGSLVGRKKVDADGFHVQPIVNAENNMVYIYGNGGQLSALRIQ